jgi:xylulokinase
VAGRYLLGIDIGTYSSKGVLIRETGEVVASRVVDHQIEMPRPGWVEHDADGVWWHDLVTICQSLLSASGVQPSRIFGIGISTISPCVLPVGGDGKPLRPAILYGIDTRATEEILELEELIGKEVLFSRYGTVLSSQSTGPKILWLRNNEPAVWTRTRMILSGTGYLVYKLTGEATLDIYDSATYAPLMDIKRLSWNSEYEDILLPLDKLPRLTWSCEVAGRVNACGAAETGLARGTPVITGTADAAAESLSAGLADAGDMMVMYGSSVFFILKTASLISSRRFWTSPFLEQGTFAVAGGMSTAGSLTKWFRDRFAAEEVTAEKSGGRNAYETLADLAKVSPAGAGGLIVLPYFAGERTPLHDPGARGVIFGLTLRHSRGDVYRAILEAVGYGIRHNIDAMREEGIFPRKIFAVGGGTLNPEWMHIVSDIAGIEQHIPAEQIGASYGDALMAGVGVGMFSDTAEASKKITTKQVILPDSSQNQIYSECYRIYRELYEKTADTMHRLRGQSP